jgi:hypothetical protein
MNISTEDLEGSALDWAVAKVMGHKIADNCYRDYIRIHLPSPKQSGYTMAFCPSTDWAVGGAIIERERISLSYRAVPDEPYWAAEIDEPLCQEYGPTALVAAMRCYVRSKLGNVVHVPYELTY